MAVDISTDKDFENKLADNPKTIVKYYADWCGSCKLFAPKFRRLSDDDRFDGITFLDVNAEENPEARKKARVDNLPYFATFVNGELKEYGSAAKEEYVVGLLENLKNA